MLAVLVHGSHWEDYWNRKCGLTPAPANRVHTHTHIHTHTNSYKPALQTENSRCPYVETSKGLKDAGLWVRYDDRKWWVNQAVLAHRSHVQSHKKCTLVITWYPCDHMGCRDSGTAKGFQHHMVTVPMVTSVRWLVHEGSSELHHMITQLICQVFLELPRSHLSLLI